MVHEPKLQAAARATAGSLEQARPRADRRRQRGRRARQHHRDPVPARGGRRRRRRRRAAPRRATDEPTRASTTRSRARRSASRARASARPQGRTRRDDEAEARGTARAGDRRRGRVPRLGHRRAVRGAPARAADRRTAPPHAPPRPRAAAGARRRRVLAGPLLALGCSSSACSAACWLATRAGLLRRHRRRATADASRSTAGLPVRPAARHPALRAATTGSGVTLDAVPAGAPRDVHRPQAALADDAENLVIALETGTARAVSARNRELLALIPASLLLTAGFAAIFIQQSDAALERLADLRRDLPRRCASPGTS